MRLIIRRNSEAPSILLGEAARQWRNDVASFFELPSQRRDRSRGPGAKHLFADSSVLGALASLQRHKCAYCETSLSEGAAIDHFRPLSNAVSSNERNGSPDHYVWFAIEWRNLMLLCPRCNAAKRNLFPVRGDRCLPLAPWEAAASERPLLINPFTVRPERHVVFLLDGQAEPRSEVGDVTISLLQLNRTDLIEGRRHALRAVVRGSRQRTIDPELLRKWLRPAAAFSGVVANHLYSLVSGEGAILPPGRDLGRQLIKMFESDFRHSRQRSTSGRRSASHEIVQAVPKGEIATSAVRELAITRVDIRGVKGVTRLALAMPSSQGGRATSCLMLLGENATGKSSVLQAIALCLMSDDQRLALSLSRDDFLTRQAHDWDSLATSDPSVTLRLEGGASCRWRWTTERPLPRESSSSLRVWAYGAHRRVGGAHVEHSSIASMFNADVALPDPSIWLSKIDDPVFNAVARALRVVLALRRDDDVYRDQARRVMVKAHGRVTPLGQLSDGYRSLLAMIADIMRSILETRGDLEYARGVVLIDEIEVHLHPRWKMRVISALRQSLPGLQFIFTTHDPLCLRGMANGEVAVIYRDARGDVQTVTDLPDVSSLRVDQLLTSDLFGLSSATDPQMDRISEELAMLAAIPLEHLSSDDRARRDTLLKAFPGIEVIGSDVGRQIAAAALTQHVGDGVQGDLALRADARKDSVKRLLDLLKEAE